MTSSDGFTTLINGKWIKSAKIFSHFELATIHQLLDLLHGLWPIALEESELKRVSLCAAAVGQHRLSEVLTLSLLASDFLADHSSLAQFSNQMGQLHIVKESPWKELHEGLCRAPNAKDGMECAGHLFFGVSGPVFATVAATVLTQMPDDLSRWTRNQLLLDPLKRNYPEAHRLLQNLGLTRHDILTPFGLLKDRADGGDAEAQLELATHFRNKGPSVSDLCDATLWTIKSAQQNHGPALDQLADAFLNGGTILPKNKSLGNRLLKRKRDDRNSDDSSEL